MKTFVKILLIAGALLMLVFFSLQSLSGTEAIPENLTVQTLVAAQPGPVVTERMDINEMPLQDNPDIYQYDDPGSVVTMYATIRKGNPSDNSDHTWQEVNDFTKFFFENMQQTEVGKAEVILQIGDENGPLPGEVGYGETVPNGTIQIRGASTSMRPQKSYKIELFDRAGLWRGQRTIALNKHIFDRTRALNKLNYDLLKEIPNITSLRTQFVHLYVKDETTTPPGKSFVDYGLFTQIEQPNRRFLENHLLDRNGQLYKLTFFEFYRYPDKIRLADDPLYDEAAFSTVLEIKGSRDHTKLIQMLEDVNNYAIPIEQTFEKYFDAENFFTWKAYNILVGSIDIQAQNYYLYSPQNGQKWYFLPWDYDTTFDRLSREKLGLIPYQYWETGIANEWGSVLHKRVFMVPKYRDLLTQKIEELKQYLTPERIEKKLDTYKGVIEPFAFRMPDIRYLGATKEEFDQFYEAIPKEIQINYDLYYESLNKPMPFFLGTPTIEANQIIFNWDEAYDFNAQDITYHFQVSRGWQFEQLLADEVLTNITSVQIPVLEPGAYFWRVTATNTDGYMQYPFDVYRDTEGNYHDGVKYFYVTLDNQILEP